MPDASGGVFEPNDSGGVPASHAYVALATGMDESCATLAERVRAFSAGKFRTTGLTPANHD